MSWSVHVTFRWPSISSRERLHQYEREPGGLQPEPEPEPEFPLTGLVTGTTLSAGHGHRCPPKDGSHNVGLSWCTAPRGAVSL